MRRSGLVWLIVLALCGPVWAKNPGYGVGRERQKPQAERESARRTATQAAGKVKGEPPTAPRPSQPAGTLPPGLAKRDKTPQGLEKKNKKPKGWDEGKKKGWSKPAGAPKGTGTAH